MKGSPKHPQKSSFFSNFSSFSNFSRPRYLIIAGLLLLIILLMLARLFFLCVTNQNFLINHAISQSIHKHIIPGNRGVIYDRNQVALAVSTPVDNIVLDPKVFIKNLNNLNNKNLSPADLLIQVPCLNLSQNNLNNILKNNSSSVFYYIAKQVPPSCADQITDLRLDGVYAEIQQKSYYPLGPALAQLVGFTNDANQGASGLELSLNPILNGQSGLAWVEKDGLGNILKTKQIITPPIQGQDVTLSIDSRLQTIAYEALKSKVQEAQADSGSVVVLDVKTGEVLTAVSYPSFNPNDINNRTGEAVKDQAITDAFEPGSTMKVLTITAGIESGKFTPDTPINTSPGRIMVGGHQIHDDSDNGMLTVTSVLTKSSNIGASKIALAIPHQLLFDQVLKAGFGIAPTTQFPGATAGILHDVTHMGDFEYATMSFGYAISASLLQMAKVYAAIGNNGIMHPISFLKLNQAPPSTQLMSKEISQQLMVMLSTVVGPEGTGLLANIPGYQVVGKTGTAHRVGPDGLYSKNHYNAVFIGLAPYPNPRVVIAVIVNNPVGHFNSFGGVSSAPIFAKVASAAMAFLNIPPTETTVDVNFFKNQNQFLQRIVNA